MNVLQLPQISGSTSQQLAQIRSYLYQMVQYLQVAQNSVGTPVTQIAGSSNAAGSKAEEVSQESWNATKALIIKSAEIVEVFSEKIDNVLSGKYVAQSAFGTYTEDTKLKLEATSKEIIQMYSDLQTLETDTAQLRDTTAYIRSGLLDYDGSGNPVYGIEVGQRNVEGEAETFKAYARFTAGKLSFYDNNRVEVAYVSNYKMYITNVEITGSLMGGGYTVDMSDGWAWIWTGG